MTYQSLPESFLKLVVDALPKPIRAMLEAYPETVWVAGGFIRDTMTGRAPKDIDVFAAGKAHLTCAIEFLRLHYRDVLTNVVETKNAVTLHMVRDDEPYVVQFVDRVFNKTPEECISEFDFSICQAAVWFEDQWWANDSLNPNVFVSAITPAFSDDILSGYAHYTAPTRNEDPGASVLRMMKFARTGWKFSDAEVAKVLARFNSVLYGNRELDILEDITSAFKTVGGYRYKRPTHNEDLNYDLWVDRQQSLQFD